MCLKILGKKNVSQNMGTLGLKKSIVGYKFRMTCLLCMPPINIPFLAVMNAGCQGL